MKIEIFILICSCSGIKKDISPEKPAVRLAIEVISGNDAPVITNGSAGTEGNKYGFEGGTVIRLKDGYHLFTSEMSGDPRWVKMKLAHMSMPD